VVDKGVASTEGYCEQRILKIKRPKAHHYSILLKSMLGSPAAGSFMVGFVFSSVQ
jgi:hypothetical protein